MAPLIEIDESTFIHLIQLWLSSNNKPVDPDDVYIRMQYNENNCMRRKFINDDYMQFLEDTFDSDNDLFYKIYGEKVPIVLKNENIRKDIYSTIKSECQCDKIDCFCYQIMKWLDLY